MTTKVDELATIKPILRGYLKKMGKKNKTFKKRYFYLKVKK
jgi:hypothetical protein